MSSRTPVNGIGYDKSLLANAPSITKEDKQEGYNPDLLEQGRPSPRPQTVPPGRTSPPSHSSHTPLPGSAHPTSKADPKYADSSEESPRKAVLALGDSSSKPKSRKKLFIILGVLGLIVVIALGAGLGVGLSKKSSGHTTDITGATNIPSAFSQTGTDTNAEPSKTTTSTNNEATGKPPQTSTTADVGVPQQGGNTVSTGDGTFTRPGVAKGKLIGRNF